MRTNSAASSSQCSGSYGCKLDARPEGKKFCVEVRTCLNLPNRKPMFRSRVQFHWRAPLESILCTEELHRRPSRPPDYEKENRALVKLVSALADSPEHHTSDTR